MRIEMERCTLCGSCVEACPVEAISMVDGRVEISQDCIDCRSCPAAQSCTSGAIETSPAASDAVLCPSCPVGCKIRPNKTGACQRFTNVGGIITRRIPLTPYQEIENLVKDDYDPAISRPLITGIGAGTTTLYPPSPYIVSEKVDGVDVVTCVTECMFSFSNVKVKLDTDKYIGEEGADVLYKGRRVGMVQLEEYGSKILGIGGIRAFTGKDGWMAAKVVADIANRKRVELQIKDGAHLSLQVGQKPIINGEEPERRRYGCGAAIAFMMAEEFSKAADEVIIIDVHITGLFGVPATDKPWEMETKSGIRLRNQHPTGLSYPHKGGTGWGGTDIQDPLEIIERLDPDRIRPGFTLLITDTNGERFCLYEFTEEGIFKPIEMTPSAKKAIEVLRQNCEPARVSAFYCAGAGGSARTGVVKRPIRLTEAIKTKKAKLTVGGAPVHILPGGAIDFMVDVEKVKPGSFSWLSVPATVAPLEYTMKLEDYKAIDGFTENIRPLKEVLENRHKLFSYDRKGAKRE